jgi:hypothetical protein
MIQVLVPTTTKLTKEIFDIYRISSISRSDRRSYWAFSMGFGLGTFALAILVLLQDRSQRCLEAFHFTKSKDGYFEGATLVICVLWWIIGTGYITRAGGIAYVASNIYFSSWFTLFSCIYTLNEWSASKDILSISELTGLSATLKSWWVLCLTSMVVRSKIIFWVYDSTSSTHPHNLVLLSSVPVGSWHLY